VAYDRARYWSDVGARIDERAAHRDVAGDDDAYHRYKRRKMIARFLSALPINGRVVMELGPGPGGNLEWLAQHRTPARLIGVDISETMVRLAQRRLGTQARLLRLEADRIPMPDASVDMAFTVTVLQHNTTAEQLRAMTHELARVTHGPIVLMEDTASHQINAESFVVRAINEYEAAMRGVGYSLQVSDFLKTRLSRAIYRRLRDRLPTAPEGDRLPAVTRAAIAAAMTITSRLDRLMGDIGDLTMMVFHRH
jgi:hypothetical protein